MPDVKRLRSEIQENMTDNIRKLSGRVFHVVRDRNLLRYRVTGSGQIVKDKVRREMRKRVTGDPEKKIRDYMGERPQVKLIDKVYFTFGVGCVVLTEYLALRHPSYFTQYYYLLMSFLVTNRYFQYKEENMELFMLDFCYFANLSTMIQTGVFPDCLIWYKANYVLCMGCLMLAIVVWQNSLVFHSLDKITSFLLHAMPPLTLHMYRWQLIPNDLIPENDSLSWSEAFFWPLILYCSWQALYTFILEVPLGASLKNNPDRITSARYLVKDHKNGMNILVTGLCKKYGWMEKDEELDADTWKAKNIFMGSQLIYTIFTIIIAPFLYENYFWSVVYIASIYMFCVWRGGTYYIEVFSERYKLQFIKDNPTEKKDDYSKSDSDDEVFEDADLFSDIVTALSEEALAANRSGDSASECDTDASDCKKDTESDDLEYKKEKDCKDLVEDNTSDIPNSGELELATSSADQTIARENIQTADQTTAPEVNVKTEEGCKVEEVIPEDIQMNSKANNLTPDNGSDSSESSYVDIKKPDSQEHGPTDSD